MHICVRPFSQHYQGDFDFLACVCFLIGKNLPALAGTGMALHIDRHKMSAIFMLVNVGNV